MLAASHRLECCKCTSAFIVTGFCYHVISMLSGVNEVVPAAEGIRLLEFVISLTGMDMGHIPGFR